MARFIIGKQIPGVPRVSRVSPVSPVSLVLRVSSFPSSSFTTETTKLFLFFTMFNYLLWCRVSRIIFSHQNINGSMIKFKHQNIAFDIRAISVEITGGVVYGATMPISPFTKVYSPEIG